MVTHVGNNKSLSYRIQKDYTKWSRLPTRVILPTRVKRGYPDGEKKVTQLGNKNSRKPLIKKGKRESKDNPKNNLKDNQRTSFKEEDLILRQAGEAAVELSTEDFNPSKFIRAMRNLGYHSEDILECIERLKERKETIGDLWAYGAKILDGLADDNRGEQWQAIKQKEKEEAEALFVLSDEKHDSNLEFIRSLREKLERGEKLTE